MESDEFKLRIRGRSWKVRWVDESSTRFDLDKYLGMCYYDERVIELSERIPQCQRTAVFIHEVVHAILPQLIEKDVERVERDLTRALVTFGALVEKEEPAC